MMMHRQTGTIAQLCSRAFPSAGLVDLYEVRAVEISVGDPVRVDYLKV